jgi:hypothetical protein
MSVYTQARGCIGVNRASQIDGSRVLNMATVRLDMSSISDWHSFIRPVAMPASSFYGTRKRVD